MDNLTTPDILRLAVDRLEADINNNLRSLRSLLDRAETPQAPAAPVKASDGPDIVPVTAWVRDNPGVISLRSIRRWCEPGGAPPGMLDQGVLVRVGTRWYIRPARLPTWIDSSQPRHGADADHQDDARRGPGRPRRAV